MSRPVPTRRDALKWMMAGTAGALLVPGCATGAGPSTASAAAVPGSQSTFPVALPDLPYAYDALAPAIDAQTMEIHHSRHHQGYINGLNAALENLPDLQSQPIGALLADLEQIPAEARETIRNTGGGYVNHALFWATLSPSGGGLPSGALADGLNQTFGSFDAFKAEFAEAAGGVFGSGWAWLVQDEAGLLRITATANQDTPLMEGQQPILGLDVWEHAYYLAYQNQRGAYVSAFWEVVDWTACSTLYAG
ncbi:MAG: superoxide dismutase [Bacteroidota bacterium]